MNARLVCLLIAMPLALCACGNKGPLVLSKPPAPTHVPAAVDPVDPMPVDGATPPVATPPAPVDDDSPG